MESNFWEQLKKPFFALAPMDDVTDFPFRTMLARHGKPDVMWTEFVSADGLLHPVGRQALLPKLEYDGEIERPIVAQIFSASPEKIRQAAYLIADLGFDGVDINMGCPDKAINDQGAGAALIKDPSLSAELVIAAKEGVSSHHHPIPVSVKTRIGWNKDELDTWLPVLLETNPAAITIHARTRKEMSKVPAKWDRVTRAVEIAKGSGVLIIGNGDVTDLADGRAKAKETGADGIMIGRASLGNPWVFNARKKNVAIGDKLHALVEHAELFERFYGEGRKFEVMRKFSKAYVSGFDHAKDLRISLMEARDVAEVRRIVREYLAADGACLKP
ncbi:MAG: tRNA-dihydrouridine synthase [Candidatus Moranbacteria bacterium]|nr:tRNA-dihydrouridine synthase [Candidatus Moranbacteria bacterium]